MMRILADGVAFQNTDQRGIQRYGREVLGRVARVHPVDLVMDGPVKAPLPDGCNVITRPERFRRRLRNLPGRFLQKTRQVLTPTPLGSHTLFHSMFFHPTPERGLPEVMSLYDMIPELFPEHFPDGRPKVYKRKAMERASKIMCISQGTADDAARLYPHIKDKLRVVYLGADHLTTIDPTADGPLPAALSDLGPYVLFVGDRALYKNFSTTIDAVADPEWPADLTLLVVGRPMTDAETASIRERGLDRRVRYAGYVTDAQLRQLYTHSLGLVFPSLGEGFGFGQLEAQSLRAPVLCSDLPIFREISGDGAIYFDPRRPAAIASAVAGLRDADTAALIAAGLENVKRFRWSTCAEQTLAVYEQVAAVRPTRTAATRQAS